MLCMVDGGERHASLMSLEEQAQPCGIYIYKEINHMSREFTDIYLQNVLDLVTKFQSISAAPSASRRPALLTTGPIEKSECFVT
jgi:hypothetical protein